MAQLPDLPEQRRAQLRKYADLTITAIEGQGKLPWVSSDHRLDNLQLAVLARGLHTLSASDQEFFFHRLTQATSQLGPLERSSAELLYHAVEALNAAGDTIAHPQESTQRDERLTAVPSHQLQDLRYVLATALLQHYRELDADEAFPLAQNALLLYARDSAGWGLSDSELAQAIGEAQKTHFTDPDPTVGQGTNIRMALKNPDFSWEDVLDLVDENRYRAAHLLEPLGESTSGIADPDAVHQAEEAHDQQSADSSEESQATEAGNNPPESVEHLGQAESDDGLGAESLEAIQNDEQGTEPPADGPVNPDEGYLFDDGVLPVYDDEMDVREDTRAAHSRGDWPQAPQKRPHKGDVHGEPVAQQKAAKDQMRGNPSGSPRQYPPPPDQNPWGGNMQGTPPYPPQQPPQGREVVMGPSLLSSVGQGVGGLINGVGGLFAGVGSALSRLGPRSYTKPEPEQTSQREDRKTVKSLEQTYRNAEQFLDRFGSRIDRLRNDERVLDTFQRIDVDRRRMQEAIRDGADAKVQEARHRQNTEQLWQRVMDHNSDLPRSLAMLESDAERLPELVDPALVALEGLPGDQRGKREALLAKLDRAKEQSEGLPPSTPGKKSLSERIGGIISAIKRFLERLFGISRPETVQVVTHSAPARSATVQRRTHP